VIQNTVDPITCPTKKLRTQRYALLYHLKYTSSYTDQGQSRNTRNFKEQCI